MMQLYGPVVFVLAEEQTYKSPGEPLRRQGCIPVYNADINSIGFSFPCQQGT